MVIGVMPHPQLSPPTRALPVKGPLRRMLGQLYESRVSEAGNGLGLNVNVMR